MCSIRCKNRTTELRNRVASVPQLIERLPSKQRVASSNPARDAMYEIKRMKHLRREDLHVAGSYVSTAKYEVSKTEGAWAQ